VLFAHQDKGRPTLTLVDADQGLINPADVICGFEQLQAAMVRLVGSATATLAIVGSRSRDRAYLATIEEVLGMRSRLIHWRVLVGPPHRQVLKDHLVRLLELRDPADRSHGMQTSAVAASGEPTSSCTAHRATPAAAATGQTRSMPPRRPPNSSACSLNTDGPARSTRPSGCHLG
jgi:hypothetical protein